MNGSIVSPATRQRVRDLASPIARGLGRLGLTPNALTLIGFLGTCLAAFAAASQAWLVAGILVLAFGIFDLFDGTLARATGRATRFGAFLDSTFDRAGEAIVYVGIAIGGLSGGSPTVAALAPAAMAAAFMVSYTRAKAESLGFATGSGMASVGFAPREVRIVILTVGLLAVGITADFLQQDPQGCVGLGDDFFACLFRARELPGELVLGGALGLITILATLTTIQRILHVRAQSREG